MSVLTRVCVVFGLVAVLAVPAVSAAADSPVGTPGVSSTVVDPYRGGPSGLACASDTSCVAVDGAGMAMHFTNGSWSAPAPVDPQSGGGIAAVSCVAGTTFCAAIGDNGNAYTTTDSTTWTGAANAITVSVWQASLSCSSATWCLGVVGQDVFTYDGTTWSHAGQAESPNGGNVTGVSCVSSTFCMAVDSIGNALEYDGTAWSATSNVVSATYSQASVSCSSVTFCVTVQGTEAAAFDGTSWSTATRPTTGSAYLMSVSCPTDEVCTAVDLAGAVADLTGGTWTRTAGVDTNDYFRAVECPRSACIAIDQFGYAFERTAGTWTSGTLMDQSTGGLQSISCPTTTFCAATDEAGNVLTYNGTVWSAPRTIEVRAVFAVVSCSSAHFCAAVGSQPNPADTGNMGAIATFDGTSWTLRPTDQPLHSLSCASDGSCVALGWSDDYVTEADGTWSADLAGPNNLGAAVSCVSQSFCATPNYVYDGTSWTFTSLPAGSAYSISCVSSTFCVSPDGMFMAVYNGTAWKLTKVAGSWSSNYAIDCVSTTFCELASNNGGSVTPFENGMPGQPTAVEGDDVPHALAGLSCPTAQRCFAVDGTAVVKWATHVAPTITSQPIGGTAPKNGAFQLMVTAQGMPTPTVQWQRSNPQGAFVDEVPGNSPWVTQGGYYRAVLTNTTGQVISKTVHVVIGTEPVVTLQPKSHGCVQGSTTTFTTGVQADPTPATTWQISHDAGKTWADVYPPRRSNTYSTTCTKTARYRAVFTSNADTVDSDAATLTVWTPPRVVTQPANRSAKAGRSVAFTAKATGSPTPAITWQSSADGTHWTAVRGAHGQTLSVTATRARSGHRYRARFTNAAGTVSTHPARLTVHN
jgi:hypothetical protein